MRELGDAGHPWERLAAETSRQWAAFCLFRDLGPERSINRAFQLHLSKLQRAGARTSSAWYAWAALHGWTERAQAYDDDRERAARIEREAARARLACQREDFELRQQERLERACNALSEKVEKALALPNTDVILRRYNDGGELVEEKKIEGVRLSEIAALNREWREALAQAINGHIKITRTGKLPETGGAERVSAVIGVAWESWPEGGNGS